MTHSNALQGPVPGLWDPLLPLGPPGGGAGEPVQGPRLRGLWLLRIWRALREGHLHQSHQARHINQHLQSTKRHLMKWKYMWSWTRSWRVWIVFNFKLFFVLLCSKLMYLKQVWKTHLLGPYPFLLHFRSKANFNFHRIRIRLQQNYDLRWLVFVRFGTLKWKFGRNCSEYQHQNQLFKMSTICT